MKVEWWRRLAPGFLGIVGLQLALWIQLAPQSFWDEFPGGGHRWVSSFGVYNEHLLRDFGAMNLAIGLLALVAAIRPDRVLVRAACGVWFVFGVQHLVFHAAHYSMLDGIDRYASPVSLVFVVAIAVAGWFLAPAARTLPA